MSQTSDIQQARGVSHTIRACLAGYVVQAIINNFAPLLYLTFQSDFKIGLEKIALITTVNFSTQLIVDGLSAKFVDRIGYRASAILAHACAALGLVLMALLPSVMPPFAGLLCASCVYAIGGGLIEVIISPIVESCPTPARKKQSIMSLLHSFYCWGHLGVVLVSTAFFVLMGVENWRILAILWAIVPAVNMIVFCLVPVYSPQDIDAPAIRPRKLFKMKLFWLLMLLMVCAGASELAMSQWASAFAESALGVSKTVGDLVGPCTFALCMGLARAFFAKMGERLPLSNYMIFCCTLCIASYLLAASGIPALGMLGCGLCGFSVGVLWPGCFSTAAKALPGGGTTMYAMLALAGDVGCNVGPTAVGMIAGAFGEDLRPALVFAIIFPVVLIGALIYYRRMPEAKES